MQQSSLAAGEVKHYSFSTTPGTNASDLTITSMAYSGVSYLYVSKVPDPEPEPDGFYRWRSIINNWVVQTISIPKEDCLVAPVGQTQCTYNIAVYSPNNPATFTIVASTSRSWTELQPGLPVQGSVGLNEYRYYTFQVPTIRTNWSITVTADGNRDTDLFVSRSERQPSPTTNEWNAGAFGGTEYLRVDWNSPVYAGTTTVGTYYVGLLGFEPAEYTIVLQLMNGMNSTTIVLFDGQPQLGVVQAGQYNHYTYTPSPVGWPYELFISVHPVSGDPDMYVRSDGGLATRESFQWGTTASTGLLDQIRITNSSVGACNPTNTSHPCHYTIGVLGWEGYAVSMYSITVSTSKSNERLGDGQVVGPRTLAANAYDYYFFSNPMANHTVTFSLIPTAGAPVMYVSSSGSFPNATTNQFPSMGNFVIISHAPSGVYYLSVHSVQPSSYSLVATSYNPERPQDDVRMLYAGTSFADVLAAVHYRYYYFDLSSVEPTDYLYVALATDAGTPRVYANFYDDRPGVFPSNATNGAQWVQTQTGNAVFALTIQAPRDGRYVLAVQAGNAAPASYRITVSLAGTTQAMYVGSTYPGRLSAGQYNYYRFTVLQLVNNADLSFTVTPQTGNPDLYVSDRTARPSAANASSYTWSSSGTGVDSVVLSNARLPGSVHVGTYYVAVYAVTDVTYTIVASYGSTIALSDGAQQYQFLNPGQQQRYSLIVPVTAGDVTIQTQQVVGTVTVYVGVNSVPIINQPNTYQNNQNNVANAFLTPPRLRCSTVGVNRSTCEYSILGGGAQQRRGSVLHPGQHRRQQPHAQQRRVSVGHCHRRHAQLLQVQRGLHVRQRHHPAHHAHRGRRPVLLVAVHPPVAHAVRVVVGHHGRGGPHLLRLHRPRVHRRRHCGAHGGGVLLRGGDRGRLPVQPVPPGVHGRGQQRARHDRHPPVGRRPSAGQRRVPALHLLRLLAVPSGLPLRHLLPAHRRGRRPRPVRAQRRRPAPV